MKIYCINNQDGYCKLTLGGSYNTQENKGDYYYIYDDNGEMKKYLKDKFTNSKELADSILDMKMNPSNYYQPIEIALHINHNIEQNQSTLGLILLNIDEGINGIGNIYEFLNLTPSYGITISSSSRNADYNKTSNYVQLGKSKGYMVTIKRGTNSNVVDLAYRIQKSIDEINKVLIYKKKEDKLVYLIEHEPNGKQYYFRTKLDESSCEIHYGKGTLVICDTSRGEQYGVICGTEYISGAKYNQLKEFKPKTIIYNIGVNDYDV